jgi:hypothetical protein
VAMYWMSRIVKAYMGGDGINRVLQACRFATPPCMSFPGSC